MPAFATSSTALTSSFVASKSRFQSSSQSRRVSRSRALPRRLLVVSKQQNKDNDSEKSPSLLPITRRQAIQLLNGALGVFTLTLLIKLRKQFQYFSPQSILSALGLSRVSSPSLVSAAHAEEARRFQDALDYVKKMENRTPISCPDFPPRSDWINSRPLSLSKELKGKVILLDFFTYCCINCQHVLPKLKQLEQKYGQDGSGGFVVIGVHSAKFTAERETANIAAAVERYDVEHPVLNDERMQLWNAIGVVSWPTLALVGPRGNLLAIWSGERQETDIDTVVAATLQYYSDEIDHRPLPERPARNDALRKLAESPLRYPGKVAVSQDGSKLFVADSGNNRVIEVASGTENVLRVFGNGEPGLVDAKDPKAVQFHSPQGLTEYNGALYVADTESQAVRMIDLKSGETTTIGGNGEQGFDYTGGKPGKQQLLSSPWDVEVREGVLYVAMAGTHQIWMLKLASEMSKTPSESWQVFSGSGRELEKNSTDARTAAWAQPSHLSCSSNGCMYIADSESSSVRSIDFNASSYPTKTIAGGDGFLAENLFAYGDKDGSGSKARFQHPLAVCADDNIDAVYVADSYNHKIKTVTDSGSAQAFCGTGKPGLKDGKLSEAMFWEPGGLALAPDGKRLYVADTNNFAIRVIDLEAKTVSTLAISANSPALVSESKPSRLIPNRRRAVKVQCDAVAPGSTTKFEIELPEQSHFTPGTTGRFQINAVSKASDDSQPSISVLSSGTIENGKGSGAFQIDLSKLNSQATDMVEVEAVTYYCTDVDDVCRTEATVFSITLSDSGDRSRTITHKIRPRKAAATTASSGKA